MCAGPSSVVVALVRASWRAARLVGNLYRTRTGTVLVLYVSAADEARKLVQICRLRSARGAATTLRVGVSIHDAMPVPVTARVRDRRHDTTTTQHGGTARDYCKWVFARARALLHDVVALSLHFAGRIFTYARMSR